MAISILCGGIVGTTLTSSSPSLLVASAQAPCCSVNIYTRSDDELELSDDQLELSADELELSDDEFDSDGNDPNWDEELSSDAKLVCGKSDDAVALSLLCCTVFHGIQNSVKGCLSNLFVAWKSLWVYLAPDFSLQWHYEQS